MKSFYFLRHGETDFNLQHIAMGSKDIPLNNRGLSQAINAGEALKNETIGTIVTSPLMRARKTADIIAEYVKAPIIELSELKEASWGVKEGMPKGRGEWMQDWRDGLEIENAESYVEFVNRVKVGLEKALEEKGPVLVISHGGVYWGLQEFLGLPLYDLGNCEVVFHSF
jgi:broad specificity phosphatase PhoE